MISFYLFINSSHMTSKCGKNTRRAATSPSKLGLVEYRREQARLFNPGRFKYHSASPSNLLHSLPFVYVRLISKKCSEMRACLTEYCDRPEIYTVNNKKLRKLDLWEDIYIYMFCHVTSGIRRSVVWLALIWKSEFFSSSHDMARKNIFHYFLTELKTHLF